MGKGTRLRAASGWKVAPEPAADEPLGDLDAESVRLTAAAAALGNKLAAHSAAAALLETELEARRADVTALEERRRILAGAVDQTACELEDTAQELALLPTRRAILDRHYVSSGGKIALAGVIKDLAPSDRERLVRELQLSTRSGVALRQLGTKSHVKRGYWPPSFVPRPARLGSSFQKWTLGELSDLYLSGRLPELTYRTTTEKTRTVPLDRIMVRCETSGKPIYRTPRPAAAPPRNTISLAQLLADPPAALLDLPLGRLDTRSRDSKRLSFAGGLRGTGIAQISQLTLRAFLAAHPAGKPPTEVSMLLRKQRDQPYFERTLVAKRATHNIVIPLDRKGAPVLLSRTRR